MVAMTMREVAEYVNTLDYYSQKDMFTFLLDRVVEATVRADKAEGRNNKVSVADKYILTKATWVKNERVHWTDDDWHTQALRKLDLKGVWPVKEKNGP